MSYVENSNLASSRLWCTQLSTYGTEIWGGDFRNFSLEGFRDDGHKDTQYVSRQSVFLRQLIIFRWPNLENFLWNYVL
jgi:hypothetical protein